MTSNFYTMVLLEDKATAVAKLPVLTGKTVSEAENQSKTGTEDNHPFDLPLLSHPVKTPASTDKTFILQ